MTNRCSLCHRPLLREPTWIGGCAYGPKCAAAVTGHKPRRQLFDRAARRVDERQVDLFAEVRG